MFKQSLIKITKFRCWEDRFSLKSHNFLTSSSNTSFVIGLISVEFFLLTSTTRIRSSFPGKVFTIRPRGHFPLGMFSSITNTGSLVRKSLLSPTHFWRCCNVGIYSFIHLFQKQSARNWAILHCFLLWRSSLTNSPGVKARVFLWSSRWFGVSGSWSFGSPLLGVRGRLFSIILWRLQQRQFEGFPIQSRHAGFQGSLSWFCGHFGSFFPRPHSYGWRMEVGTSIGTVDTRNNEFRPLADICSDDPGSTAQLLNEFLYLHQWSSCHCRSIFPLEIHGWKWIVWELE